MNSDLTFEGPLPCGVSSFANIASQQAGAALKAFLFLVGHLFLI